MTLTTEDLQSIKQIMNEAIESKIRPMITEAVDELARVMHDTIAPIENDMTEVKSDIRDIKWRFNEVPSRVETEHLRERMIRLEHGTSRPNSA